MEDAAMEELLTLLAESEGPLDAWEDLGGPSGDWRDVPLAARISADALEPALAPEERDSEDNSSSSGTPQRSVPQQKRRTRKQELSSLRETVARLAEQLGALKLAAGIDVETPVARVPATQQDALALVNAGAGGTLRGPSLGLWKKIAAGQLDRRRASESENRALRMAVATHIRRAKRLKQTLLKRALDEHRQLSRVLKRPEGIVRTTLADDELVFRKLAEGMDAAYASIDNTFQQVEMHKVPRPGRLVMGEATITNDGVTLRQVHIVPFALKDAQTAVWAYYTGQPGYSANEVTKSFRFPYTLVFGTVMMQQRTMSRRYKESGRTVIINRSLTEPMAGIKSCTSVQLVVKPGAMSTSGPTSAIEVYVTGSGTATLEAREKISKLLYSELGVRVDSSRQEMHLWEKALDRMMDTIDNILVTHAVSGNNTI